MGSSRRSVPGHGPRPAPRGCSPGRRLTETGRPIQRPTERQDLVRHNRLCRRASKFGQTAAEKDTAQLRRAAPSPDIPSDTRHMEACFHARGCACGGAGSKPRAGARCHPGLPRKLRRAACTDSVRGRQKRISWFGTVRPDIDDLVIVPRPVNGRIHCPGQSSPLSNRLLSE